MKGAIVNPGSLNFRLGQVLNLYEQAVAVGDLERAAALLDLIATYVSVHITEKDWRQLEAMPGFAYGDERTRAQVFNDLNARLRFILARAKAKGVFARAEIEIGDASELDGDE